MPDLDDYPQFTKLHRLIRQKAAAGLGPQHYRVPQILAGGRSARILVDVGPAYLFFLSVLDTIWQGRAASRPGHREPGICSDDRVYLAFARTFASLDGAVGTALTQIMFLPYLRANLDITVFISLPTGTIGETARKGSRGSPFAVSDPFAIDPSLADPLVPELGALEQYQALVQACLLLGMRAGSVVPLATLSIDSPLFARDPALGFWRDVAPDEPLQWADPSVPRTHPGTYPWFELSASCAARFVAAPDASEVRTESADGGGHYVAVSTRAGVPRRLSLAPAFPGRQDAGGTPFWADVAMLNFTSLPYPLPAGCYTPELDDPSRPAFQLAATMIAWRHVELREEVFFVDVSGTVPDAVFQLARQLSARQADRTSPIVFVGEQVWKFDRFSDAIDAVVGPLIFCVSAHTGNVAVLVESMNYHLAAIKERVDSNPYMAGTGNHDSLPARPDLSPLLLACYHFLPRAVPLIYAGSEFHAQLVTNKEFGFGTSTELQALRGGLADADLPLFNDVPLNWEMLPEFDDRGRPVIDIPELLRRCRSVSRALTADLEGYDTVCLPGMTNCSGYRRFKVRDPRDSLVVLVNWDGAAERRIRWPFGAASRVLGIYTGAEQGTLSTGGYLRMPPRSAAVWVTGASRRRAPAADSPVVLPDPHGRDRSTATSGNSSGEP